MQHFRKILNVDSETKVFKVFGPIQDKKVPFGGQKIFFENTQYCQLCLLIVPYHCAKFQKNI